MWIILDNDWIRLDKIGIIVVLPTDLSLEDLKPTVLPVAIMGQSVKTSEKGGVRGFDGHKRVKGRKRHILVDVLGLPLANRVEPANMSDPVAGARLDPNDADAFANRCDAYLGKGQYDRVIADCDQAIRLNPNDAAAFANRGRAYRAKGQYEPPPPPPN